METKFPKGTGGFINPERIVENFGLYLGMKIADFGCGHGYFVIPMAKAVGSEGKVCAVDVQELALGAVRSKAASEGLFNIEYIHSNLEKEGGSKLPAASQDMVLLANTLYQSPGKSEIMREAGRVLKKQGILIIIDWMEDTFTGPPRESRISRETARTLAEAEGFRLMREFSAGEYHYGLVMAKMM